MLHSLRLFATCAALTTAFVFLPGPAVGMDIDGFTQPYQSVDLASDEAGAIAELAVTEGAVVHAGQVIAKLDDRLQQIQLQMARHQVDSISGLEAARQAYLQRKLIHERISELRSQGHASESELIRAEMELSIAHANFLSAQEENEARQIELQRAQVQLDRRSVLAPFDGIVARIHRHQGEYLSPMRPEVVTLIQVDTLLAVFNIPSSQVKQFQADQIVPVFFVDGRQVNGQVENVGVQTEAESGTVELRIRLDNVLGLLRAGEQCHLKY